MFSHSCFGSCFRVLIVISPGIKSLFTQIELIISNMEPVTVTSMPMICRELVFCNGRAYSITDTILKMHHFHELTPIIFPLAMYEECIAKLMEMKYVSYLDLEDFITDPMTHNYVQLEQFFWEWGVEEVLALDDHDYTVGTFELTTIDSTLDGEECISDEDEDVLVETVGALLQMRDPHIDFLHEEMEIDEDDVTTL
ncbi:MAG: hypothetical protein QKV60_gp1 [Avonheates virus SG_28]|uniref:hypothetical protein n=1 Tax=Avonheates virus SG_28 TaxID=2914484 RepID=UPI002481DC44|nr:MAG: hypothetical protein QKV60_gp1 [Avonheates virus SG_28]UNI72613.1 MAG: hypothetical protein [Avonheates virus SG_28]